MKIKPFAVLISLLFLTSCSSQNNTSVNPSTLPATSAPPTAFKSAGDLKVHYIDVGQGDSILVQTPGGKVMLIDAGKKEDGDKVVNYIKSQGIQKIDILVNTNPADDHIGGLTQVVNSFEVTRAYIPRKYVSSPAQTDFLNAVDAKKVKLNQILSISDLGIDPLVGIQVLAPSSYNYTELGDYSAVIKLNYGDNSFLFTGDAQSASEKEMLSKDYSLESTVLKVSCHGAGTATTPDFLKAVSPKYAVISVGKGNSLGNPAKETLDKLSSANVQIYRTDEMGTIVATTDGLTLKFDTGVSPSKSATPVPSKAE